MEIREDVDLSWIGKTGFGPKLGELWLGLEHQAAREFPAREGFELRDSKAPWREGAHWNAALVVKRWGRERLRVEFWVREDWLGAGRLALKTPGGMREWLPFLLPRPLRRARLESFLRRVAVNFRAL